MTFHILRFKDPPNCPIFESIKKKIKVVEGRKNSSNYSKIKVGDYLYLDDKKGILFCKVTYIHKYKDVKSYLEGEGIQRALPCVNSVEEGVKIYETFVPKKQIDELNEKYGYGFLGIGIDFIGLRKKHFIPVSNPWFDFIAMGKKIVEGRLKKGKFKDLNKNDLILFVHGQKNVLIRITDLVEYKTISDMLQKEGLKDVLPGVNTIDDGVEIYRKFYSEDQEKEFGVLAIKIEKDPHHFEKKYKKYKFKYKKTKQS